MDQNVNQDEFEEIENIKAQYKSNKKQRTSTTKTSLGSAESKNQIQNQIVTLSSTELETSTPDESKNQTKKSSQLEAVKMSAIKKSGGKKER